nr:FecR family protein [Chitinophaga sp. Cy-1792]
MGRPQLIVFNTTDDRKVLTLPDGSQIQLEKASSISYTQHFGSSNRELTLTGEAFFNVNTDGKHPFVINTAAIKTTVLGTSFNMSVREGEAPKVVVVSGKIQVKAKAKGTATEDNAVILTANKEVVFNLSTNEPTIIDGTDDARFYAMKSAGKFSYKDVRISDIARDIERLYNVKIDVKESLAGCLWNGDLYPAEGLMQMLDFLTAPNSGSVKVIANEKEYMITGSCPK